MPSQDIAGGFAAAGAVVISYVIVFLFGMVAGAAVGGCAWLLFNAYNETLGIVSILCLAIPAAVWNGSRAIEHWGWAWGSAVEYSLFCLTSTTAVVLSIAALAR
jgi:hypothetical protein